MIKLFKKKIHIASIILLILLSFQSVDAQNKSKKKSKKEKKIAQFQKLKEHAQDTAFVFQTKKILSPYIANNWSGGYLSVERQSIRIQELDWVNAQGQKTRLKDGAKLSNYLVVADEVNYSFTVTFNCQINGSLYLFTFINSIKDGGNLKITRGSESVSYSGKFKQPTK